VEGGGGSGPDLLILEVVDALDWRALHTTAKGQPMPRFATVAVVRMIM